MSWGVQEKVDVKKIICSRNFESFFYLVGKRAPRLSAGNHSTNNWKRHLYFLLFFLHSRTRCVVSWLTRLVNTWTEIVFFDSFHFLLYWSFSLSLFFLLSLLVLTRFMLKELECIYSPSWVQELSCFFFFSLSTFVWLPAPFKEVFSFNILLSHSWFKQICWCLRPAHFF